MELTHPDIGSNTLVHDGARYLIVRVSPGSTFDDYDGSSGNHVLYDKELGGSIAYFSETSGGFIGSILAHCGYPDRTYSTIPEAVKGFSDEYESYLNGIVG
jgi:hypothetical protein